MNCFRFCALLLMLNCFREPYGTLIFGWSSTEGEQSKYEIMLNGRVMAEVHPNGAKPAAVILEGRVLTQQGPVHLNVPYGEHEVAVKKDGRVVWKQRVHVSESATELYFGLEAEKNVRGLALRSNGDDRLGSIGDGASDLCV